MWGGSDVANRQVGENSKKIKAHHQRKKLMKIARKNLTTPLRAVPKRAARKI